jgi:CUB domain
MMTYDQFCCVIRHSLTEFAVIDVCSSHHTASRKLTGRQRGFIRTPGFPSKSYPNGVDCEVTVEAPHAFQKVLLDAVDIQLETNGTGCADWLEMFDGLQSTTLCGRRARRRLGVSSHRTYRIRFRSNERVQQKGFLIYFEGKTSSKGKIN